MHLALRAVLLAAFFAAPAADAVEPPPRPPQPQAPRTAKERLSGKHSDEQRVDDCKVPPDRRTRPRPTACPWDFGS